MYMFIILVITTFVGNFVGFALLIWSLLVMLSTFDIFLFDTRALFMAINPHPPGPNRRKIRNCVNEYFHTASNPKSLCLLLKYGFIDVLLSKNVCSKEYIKTERERERYTKYNRRLISYFVQAFNEYILVKCTMSSKRLSEMF